MSRPARVLIKFVDDEFEGREEWVPPARLKVLWSEVDEFVSRERRWTAVIEASPVRDTPAEYALDLVFRELIESDLVRRGFNSTGGVVYIYDVDGLAQSLGIDPDLLRGDPLSFVENGALIAPASIATLIASTAARRNPEPILRYVDKEEAEYRQKAIYGEDYGSGDDPPGHIDAEWFVDELDAPYNQPWWDLLRAWCGSDALERHDELIELRREVVRLGKLAQHAVIALRAAGQTREADRIERDLGIPVAELRGR
jgi:hypothetical protein